MRSSELLNEIHSLFQGIKVLAAKQKELVSDDKIEAFLALSSKRDQLQNAISGYEKEYGEIMKESPPKGVEGTGSVSAEINDEIKAIQEIDLKIEKLILQKRGELLAEMKTFRHGQKALKGYGGKASGSPRFIDRRS